MSTSRPLRRSRGSVNTSPLPQNLKGGIFRSNSRRYRSRTVYLNGRQVGEHKGAYTPFPVDITTDVRIGRDNVLAVRVDSRRRGDIRLGRRRRLLHFRRHRARCGAGHHRSAPCRMGLRGKGFGTTDASSRTSPYRRRAKEVRRHHPHCRFVGRNCRIGGGRATIAANAAVEFDAAIGPIPSLRLWQPDHPYVYTAITQVYEGNRQADELRQTFGVRSFTFSRTTGFFIMEAR